LEDEFHQLWLLIILTSIWVNQFQLHSNKWTNRLSQHWGDRRDRFWRRNLTVTVSWNKNVWREKFRIANQKYRLFVHGVRQVAREISLFSATLVHGVLQAVIAFVVQIVLELCWLNCPMISVHNVLAFYLFILSYVSCEQLMTSLWNSYHFQDWTEICHNDLVCISQAT
jgi:hypothetical protein